MGFWPAEKALRRIILVGKQKSEIFLVQFRSLLEGF